MSVITELDRMSIFIKIEQCKQNFYLKISQVGEKEKESKFVYLKFWLDVEGGRKRSEN